MPETVVVPSGSGLTHVGMLAGLRAAGFNGDVWGVCVRRDAPAQRMRIVSRAEALIRLLDDRGDLAGLIRDGDVQVSDRALSPGYGRLDGDLSTWLSTAARLEGLILDPVYSAKSMHGLAKLVGGGQIDPGSRVLWLHTGGQPALFGYEAQLSSMLRGDEPVSYEG